MWSRRSGPGLPAERADQHHPQLGARGRHDLVLGPWRPTISASAVATIAVTIRLERIRRSSADHGSVPGSRSRSVASSRSNSSIWCRIAVRTAGGPAARSRTMNAKCCRCASTCSTSTVTEPSMMSLKSGSPRRTSRSIARSDTNDSSTSASPSDLDRVEVAVERGRHDADLLGDLAQRQRDQAAVLAEVERGVQDRATGALLALAARLRHASQSSWCTCVHTHTRRVVDRVRPAPP